ncbi:hypothetical protein BGZ57DRAFT_985225 [Hyaloscypha finlandica]|nr:hypothetical protein BGZ57DRAFT_985225 [Hyaloscypha finlandica]
MTNKVTELSQRSKTKFNRRQENQELQHERQAILDWLTPIEYTSQQSGFISRRQAEKTGQWLLASEEFRAWLKTDKQTLFCRGIPGAGKTIFTSIIVEELTTRFCANPEIGVTYVYCNFRCQNEQKIDDLLANHLKQLSEGWPSLPVTVRELYNRHMATRTRPSLNEISECLRIVIMLHSRGFCSMNLFITSRPIPNIERDFVGNSTLEIRASEEDVRRYLDDHLVGFPRFVDENSELREEIKTTIIKAVNGMFLLARLYLKSLAGKKSPKAIRAVLKNLAPGSKAYDQVYEDTMERINSQLIDQAELAKQYALAIEISESQLDEENLPAIEDMISVYAGLVMIDTESDIIQLVHYTAQECFTRTEITTTCVIYLPFNEFGSGIRQTDEEFEQRPKLNKLYNYASNKWGYHARAASTLCQELHLVAYFGVHTVVELLLLEKGADAKATNSYGETALSRASKDGHLKVVELLLAKDSSMAATNRHGWIQPHEAAKNGHLDVVQLPLRKGPGIESKDDRERTPLSYAAECWHEATVQLLLNWGAELETKASNSQTPLSWAAASGHEGVVQLLLKRAAELETKASDG